MDVFAVPDFGRQPHMLLPLEIQAEAGEGEVQPSRIQWRVREISLQRMIEATSIARVGRALRTRRSTTGVGKFNVGDMVGWAPPK